MPHYTRDHILIIFIGSKVVYNSVKIVCRLVHSSERSQARQGCGFVGVGYVLGTISLMRLSEGMDELMCKCDVWKCWQFCTEKNAYCVSLQTILS